MSKVGMVVFTLAFVHQQVDTMANRVRNASSLQAKQQALREARRDLEAMPLSTKSSMKHLRYNMALLESQDIVALGASTVGVAKDSKQLKEACDEFHTQVSDQYRHPVLTTVKAQRLVEAVGCGTLDYRR